MLVDLAPTAGQALLMHNLLLRKTRADLTRMEAAEIDQEGLSQAKRHHPSGVHGLSAPYHVEESELVVGSIYGDSTYRIQKESELTWPAHSLFGMIQIL